MFQGYQPLQLLLLGHLEVQHPRDLRRQDLYPQEGLQQGHQHLVPVVHQNQPGVGDRARLLQLLGAVRHRHHRREEVVLDLQLAEVGHRILPVEVLVRQLEAAAAAVHQSRPGVVVVVALQQGEAEVHWSPQVVEVVPVRLGKVSKLVAIIYFRETGNIANDIA